MSQMNPVTDAMPLFRIQGLGYRYARQLPAALEQITLDIPRGSMFGLLGPNGAGKTTLLSILLGLRQADEGVLLFDGLPLAENLATVRAHTGFVPQDLAFYPTLSVAENLAFYVRAFGVARTWRASRVDEAVAAVRLEGHLHKQAQRLSGGLKRRLNLAIGLLSHPQVLFLDEPTVGIDPQSRNFILETIARLNREQGMTVIYTSHYMEEVQHLCDHIAIIDAGRILVQGPLSEMLGQARDRQLRIELESGPGPSLQQALKALGLHAQSAQCYVSEPGVALLPLLQQVLDKLSAEGQSVTGIRYGQTSLEALYMQHTDAALRE